MAVSSFDFLSPSLFQLSFLVSILSTPVYYSTLLSTLYCYSLLLYSIPSVFLSLSQVKVSLLGLALIVFFGLASLFFFALHLFLLVLPVLPVLPVLLILLLISCPLSLSPVTFFRIVGNFTLLLSF